METIKIEVKGAKTVDFKSLKQVQGKLKELTEANYLKLKRSFLEDGITEPITVWENKGKTYVVNGHQRLKTLMRMVYDEGYKCPKVPVSVMRAKDLKEVKRKLASLASQYGTFTEDGVAEFLKDSSIALNDLVEKYEFSGFNSKSFVDKLLEHDKKEEEQEAQEAQEEKTKASKASVKKFQLSFDEKSAAEFTLMLEQLAFKYNTTNITDTIFTAVKQAFQKKVVTRTKNETQN